MAWRETEKTRKSYGAGRKEAEDAAWIQKRGSGGVCLWRVQGRETQNCNRFPIWAVMPRATFPKLLQHASLFQRLGPSLQMAAWPWSTLLIHNPDLGSHGERNKTPTKSQPIPVLWLPQICPITTTQPHAQVYTWQKEGMLLQLTSVKPLLCNSPGTHFNRDYHSINERRGPLNYVASCQVVLQPPAVTLKEI